MKRVCEGEVSFSCMRRVGWHAVVRHKYLVSDSDTSTVFNSVQR